MHKRRVCGIEGGGVRRAKDRHCTGHQTNSLKRSGVAARPSPRGGEQWVVPYPLTTRYPLTGTSATASGPAGFGTFPPLLVHGPADPWPQAFAAGGTTKNASPQARSIRASSAVGVCRESGSLQRGKRRYVEARPTHSRPHLPTILRRSTGRIAQPGASRTITLSAISS